MSHETESLSARQAGLGAEEATLREALTALRADMERSVSLVEQERRGMDSLAERIAEIRAEVREYESKLQVLNESGRHIVGLHGQTQHLYAQVSGLTTEFKALGEKAERARILQAEAARLEQLLAGLGLRVQKIEDARPAVETAMRDLGVLRGSEDAVRDALEEVGRAQQELARLRESQGDTEKWLSRSDESTRTLKGQVNELLALEPLVERVRKDVDRVTTSLDLADTRVAQLDDLSQRVANMHALGYELNERTAALTARMDGAEQRFSSIAGRADEADTVADRIAEVANWIGDADRRMSSLAEALDGLGGKARVADELKERLRQLEDELSRREGGLERAMEQLGRAPELRRDGADSAERLEEVVRVAHRVARHRRGAVARAGALQRRPGRAQHRAQPGAGPAAPVRGAPLALAGGGAGDDPRHRGGAEPAGSGGHAAEGGASGARRGGPDPGGGARRSAMPGARWRRPPASCSTPRPSCARPPAPWKRSSSVASRWSVPSSACHAPKR